MHPLSQLFILHIERRIGDLKRFGLDSMLVVQVPQVVVVAHQLLDNVDAVDQLLADGRVLHG